MSPTQPSVASAPRTRHPARTTPGRRGRSGRWQTRPVITPFPDQRPARVRLEWGLTGALQLLGPHGSASLVVVVDVLSFSTAVTVACEQGVVVHPYPHRDPAGAEALAVRPRRRAGAAARRRAAQPLAGVAPAPARRSARPAVAERRDHRARSGEHRRHGRRRLPPQRVGRRTHRDRAPRRRPAERRRRSSPPASGGPTEACARASRTCSARARSPRPSATTCRARPARPSALWRATPDPAASARDSTSGRELTTAGWADDVTIAVDLDATDTVARLVDDGAGPAFTAA